MYKSVQNPIYEENTKPKYFDSLPYPSHSDHHQEHKWKQAAVDVRKV